jgi:hypothetical protein
VGLGQLPIISCRLGYALHNCNNKNSALQDGL